MIRTVTLLSILLCACAGGGTPATREPARPGPTGAAGPAGPGDAGAATPAAPDPARPFRLAYVAPGGMWMPAQMTLPAHVETLRRMGVALDPAALADPLRAPLAAIVWLGGCTASFVSPEGLIVTNHHCVQGALQQNSTPEDNLVENGFLARTRAEERPAGPAQRVMVVQAYRDVTREMREGLEAIADPVARKEEAETRQKRLVASCEQDRPGIRCQVSAFFGGGLYQLIEMLELRDVRLVYAPARSVGDYGGEIDNWEWPRHTGDWSFYRAYVGPDGRPADPAADNVPLRPRHWLKVSAAGLEAGDFVMVAGYPGRTERTVTASEVRHDLAWTYPYVIAHLEERYAIAEAHLAKGGETAIKATLMKQGVQNGLESYQGELAGMQRGGLLAAKEALDARVKEWAAGPGRERERAAIDRLEVLLAEARRTARVDYDRAMAFGGSRLLSTAIALVRWAEEREKADPARKPGFQERDLPRALAAQRQLAKSYDRSLDRAGLRLALVRAARLPAKDRPWLATLLGAPKGRKIDEALIDRTLDAWYGSQLLEGVELRLELLERGTPAALRATKDPFVQAALRIWPIYKTEERKQDARAGELLLVRPVYVEALRQVLGGVLAPDANSTLRITYGTVRSLAPGSSAPRDWPFTLASQILAKDTGNEPFNAPAKLLEAIRARRYGPYASAALGGELPIDFLSDLDITGGNSGSPTLNGKGELVGLAFDGNKEGLASDLVFNPATTRTIHVDARYLLWTMDLLDGADHLLREMGVGPRLP